MAEPGLDSPEAARFYEWGPAFDDLASDLTPDQKHRYTQYRAMQRQRDLSRTSDQDVLRKRGEESRALRDMFIRPDERERFDFLEESENEDQSKNPAPFGKQYGSDYASQTSAMLRNPIRLSTGTQRALESSPTAYADGNSRYVGISERTFMPETKLQKMAKKYKERRGK